MKKLLKIILLSLSTLNIFVSCSNSEDPSSMLYPIENTIYSNLFDDKTQAEVLEELTIAGIPEANVEKFSTWLNAYKDIQGNSKLPVGFLDYPIEPIIYGYEYNNNWNATKVNYSDVNSRLTAFLLFKDYISSPSVILPASEILAFDRSAISNYDIVDFSEEDIDKFFNFFTEIPTDHSENQAFHVNNIIKTWNDRGIKFTDSGDVSMINIFFHDPSSNLLFINHSAILVKTDYGYLLVDKHSPEYPYQATRFKTREDVYTSLINRFSNDANLGGSKPIYMENSKFVNLDFI